MHPEASPKPVMDVTPPRPSAPGGPLPVAPPAPAPTVANAGPAPMPASPAVATSLAKPDSSPLQSLAVHEPPKLADEVSSSPATQPAATAQGKEQTRHKAVKPLPAQPEPEKPKATQKPGAHLQPPPVPVGAIVMTVLVMIILAGLTIVAYVRSK